MMNELKDKVYELEGLLELQALRPEKSEDLLHLIAGRIRDINALWKAANEKRQDREQESDAEPGIVETVREPEPSIYSVPEDEDGLDLTFSTEEAEEPMVQDLAGPGPEAQAEAPGRPVPALCLNDRYRFIRVIAGGDRQLFDRMLHALADLNDYDAARDYVLAQSHADPDDPEVMDFLEILQQYYE